MRSTDEEQRPRLRMLHGERHLEMVGLTGDSGPQDARCIAREGGHGGTVVIEDVRQVGDGDNQRHQHPTSRVG